MQQQVGLADGAGQNRAFTATHLIFFALPLAPLQHSRRLLLPDDAPGRLPVPESGRYGPPPIGIRS